MSKQIENKQNESDAEQALKDFLKELVLDPLEVQQKNFFTNTDTGVVGLHSLSDCILDVSGNEYMFRSSHTQDLIHTCPRIFLDNNQT